MLVYVLLCLRWFFIVLDCVVLIFLIRTMIPFGEKATKFILSLMLPMLFIMHGLLRRSILHTQQMDISPYLLLIVLSYLQDLCSIIIHIYS